MAKYADWRNAGKAYLDFFHTQTDALRRDLLDPFLIENINPNGKIVLDLGCGEGYLSRKLKQAGTQRVVGADVSPELIAAAKKAGEAGEYRIWNAETDEIFEKNSFDAVVANLMLMDLADLAGVYRKTHAFLKPGGILAASIVNPYYAYPAGVWKRNPREFLKGNFAPVLQINNYFNHKEKSINMPETPHHVPHFHRSLSEYINSAIAAGFSLTKFIEPKIDYALKEKYKRTFLANQLAEAPLFQILIFKK